MRRLLTVALSSLALLVVTAATLSASEPQPGALTDEERAAAAAFDRISPAFEQLAEVPGFESGGLKDGTDELEVYWSGELSDEAKKIIAEAEARGEPVHVREVRSYDSVWKLSLTLAKVLRAEGIQLSGFGPNRENDAIELLGPKVSTDQRLQERVRDIARSILPEGLSVEFIPDESGSEFFNSRHDDTGYPTIGGELRIRGGECTSGLGMRRDGNGHYSVTAAHCSNFDNGFSVTIPGNNNVGQITGIPTLLGPVPNSENSTRDLLDASLVSYGAGGTRVSDQIFVGTNTTSTTAPILGTTTIPFDLTMCTSGSGTGTRCNVERTSQQVRRCVISNNSSDGCFLWLDIVGVNSTNGLFMFGGGDSGGAVYVPRSDGRYVAALIQGAVGGASSACGSANFYPGQQCVTNQGRVTSMKNIREALPNDFIPNVE